MVGSIVGVGILLSLYVASIVKAFTSCENAFKKEEISQLEFLISRVKKSISQAEYSGAWEYAPKKYQQAQDALRASHDLMPGKNDFFCNYKDAKEKAKEAEALARRAKIEARVAAYSHYKKRAEETKGEAEIVLGKAKERYAAQFAPDQYKNAQDLIASGDEKFNEGKAMEASADYEKARSEAEKARNIAEATVGDGTNLNEITTPTLVKTQAIEESEPLTEEEKEAKRFATWKSDSNKILLVIDKVLPLMNKLNSYGEDSSDVEVKAKLKKKLFDKTFKKIKEGLKKINRNLRKNIKLQVVKLKEFKEQTALNNYGEKYKAKLTEKFRSKLKRKYKHLFKVFEKNLIDLDFYNSSTGLGSLMSLGMATQFAILKTADPRVGKLSADFIKNAMLLQSKLKACKKCYGKPYFALTFELLVPENNHCKKYLYGSKLLISREYDSADEYSNSVRYTCTTKGITIYAYIGSISDSEVLALKKGALYSLHGELYHVDYEANQSSSADKIILRFNLKSLKSIQKIE